MICCRDGVHTVSTNFSHHQSHPKGSEKEQKGWLWCVNCLSNNCSMESQNLFVINPIHPKCENLSVIYFYKIMLIK